MCNCNHPAPSKTRGRIVGMLAVIGILVAIGNWMHQPGNVEGIGAAAYAADCAIGNQYGC